MQQPVEIARIKRLLLRGPNWLGDAVMCEPALAAARRLFHGAEITLLAKPPVAELFKGHPDLDCILAYQDPGQHAGFSGKWLLAETLRRQRFDMAVLFQNAFSAAFLAFLAGIPRRYGYSTDGRRFLLSDPVPVPVGSQRPHQVDYYLRLLEPLGLNAEARSPRLYLSAEDTQAANSLLAEAGIDEQEFLIGLNPGSTYGTAKRWLPERFAEAADRLVRDIADKSGAGARVVIVGAKGEEALGLAIAERMQATPLRLAGRTTVRQLMAVVGRCGLFLTNDTGPMHIAAALGVPVAAIFGPTDSRTTSPFGGRHRIISHPVDCAPCLLRECPIDHRCMTRLTVDEVYGAATRLLDSRKSERPMSESPGWKTVGPSDVTTSLNGVTVFLDRDGTLNRDSGYVGRPDELELFPDTIEAVAQLTKAGARVVLITNQSGVGRGLFTHEDVGAVHRELRERLAGGGGTLHAIYYCPHHPDDSCLCRKPRTGMIDRAAEDLGLDLSSAYVVGDQKRDMELARSVGARAVMVTTGPTSTESLARFRAEGPVPDYVASSLREAVKWIMQDAPARAVCKVKQ